MRATRGIDRLQTEISIVPPLLPDCHLPLSPSHTDDTEYSDQAGLCFSKQPPTAQTPVSSGCRHSVTATALSAGPGRDRDTTVRERDGRGRVACGNGRARDGNTLQHTHIILI